MWVDPFSFHPEPSAAPRPRRGADAVAEWLCAQGVRRVFGVTGGGVAHLRDALNRTPLQVVHTQHESGAAFAATEASLESDEPVAVFTTTGPGLTNALTGLVAARQEGARVLVLSAATPEPRRLRGATQETSDAAPFPGLFTSGPLFDEAALVSSAAVLAPALQRAAEVLARPGGAVVHLGFATDVLSGEVPSTFEVGAVSVARPGVDEAAVDAVAGFVGARVCVVVGFGARAAAAPLRRLLARTGWLAVSTPRGKGIVPEDHPQCAGVLGLAGHAAAEGALAQRPDVVLALGTGLGEASSGWVDALRPRRLLVQVGATGEVMAGPYPSAPLLAVPGSVEAFVAALAARLGAEEPPPAHPASPRPALAPQEGPVRPRFLFDAVQRVVVDRSDALVMAESGNAFCWAIHHLRLASPRLRVSVGWGSMGHMTAGVVGPAALGRRAVALVGDGALLMGNELATAVRDHLPATWIVLDDGQYGMCRHGDDAQGLTGSSMALPAIDFARLAAAMGMRSERVTREVDLEEALARSLLGDGPALLDVVVDPRAVAPIGRRIRALTWHAGEGS